MGAGQPRASRLRGGRAPGGPACATRRRQRQCACARGVREAALRRGLRPRAAVAGAGRGGSRARRGLGALRLGPKGGGERGCGREGRGARQPRRGHGARFSRGIGSLGARSPRPGLPSRGAGTRPGLTRRVRGAWQLGSVLWAQGESRWLGRGEETRAEGRAEPWRGGGGEGSSCEKRGWGRWTQQHPARV